MMLECPGVFVAPLVPDGWTATGRPEEFYQLEPSDGAASTQISVYRRASGPLREHEARDLVAAFVHKAIGSLRGEIRVVTRRRTEQRACSRCTHPGEDGEPVDWFVMGIVWPATVLMCSYNGMPGDPAMGDAERMLASIVPLGNHRWLPWRR
jgi:hypothetical protein